MSGRWCGVLFALFAGIVALPVSAQHSPVGPAPSSPVGPFAVFVHGHYQQMMRHKDFSAKVTLAAVRGDDQYGVGALAGRAGEVTVIRGKPFISPGANGDGSTAASVPDDTQATLLVTGSVKSWKDVVLPRDMTEAEFEDFVVSQAAKTGIPADVPFAFMVQGTVRNYVWHVIAADMKDHRAEGIAAEGELVGFYASPSLSGIASHPGELFHVHYLDSSRTHGGHVDRYQVVQGAVLSLPLADAQGRRE